MKKNRFLYKIWLLLFLAIGFAACKKGVSDIEKVEEQFTEHCNDIIGSDCTAAEKANYIAYLLTEKTPSTKK